MTSRPSILVIAVAAAGSIGILYLAAARRIGEETLRESFLPHLEPKFLIDIPVDAPREERPGLPVRLTHFMKDLYAPLRNRPRLPFERRCGRHPRR